MAVLCGMPTIRYSAGSYTKTETETVVHISQTALLFDVCLFRNLTSLTSHILSCHVAMVTSIDLKSGYSDFFFSVF